MSSLPIAQIRTPVGFRRDTRFIGGAMRPGMDGLGGAPAPADPEPAPATGETREDAYERGYREGLEAARAEAEAHLAQDRAAREAIALSFARLDLDCGIALRDRLRATVLTLCEQAVLPVAVDVDGLARRIEAAVALFQRKDDERIVHLHPEDIALVEPKLEPPLRLCADPALERGALRIESEDGGIEDGPEQWRLALLDAFSGC